MKTICITALMCASVGIFFGCKEDQSCTPGKSEACPCANGADGIQVCKTDGSGWGVCNCSGGVDSDMNNEVSTDTNVVPDCAEDVSDFNTCIDCYCDDEVTACDENTDCLDLAYCLGDCGTDTDCQNTCATDYADGVDDLIAFLDCRDADCADYMTAPDCTDEVADFGTCLDCYCADELATCDGNTDCVDLLYCLNDCGTDTACQDTCAADYAAGVDDLVAVLDCRDANCAGYMNDPTECAPDVVDFGTCLDCYCGGFVGVCDANTDCVDLLYCLSDCGTDTACQDDCAVTYPDGITDLVNVLDCRDANCADYMS